MYLPAFLVITFISFLPSASFFPHHVPHALMIPCNPRSTKQYNGKNQNASVGTSQEYVPARNHSQDCPNQEPQPGIQSNLVIPNA